MSVPSPQDGCMDINVRQVESRLLASCLRGRYTNQPLRHQDSKQHERSRSMLPPLRLVLSLSAEERRIVEFLIVLQLQMRKLQPDSRCVECIHVGGETPVRIIDVSANLLRILD